jgi:hypothetical protein
LLETGSKSYKQVSKHLKQETTFKTLEDIEFSKILHKYRDWNKEYYKRFIVEREVFMVSPNQFEDKLDCKSPVRNDLIIAEQAKVVYTRISNYDEKLSTQQKRKRVRELLNKKDYLNPVMNDNYQKIYFRLQEKKSPRFSPRTVFEIAKK